MLKRLAMLLFLAIGVSAQGTHWIDAVQDQRGNGLANVTVTVFAAGTSTPLTVYTNVTLTTIKSTPIVTDSAGRYDFYVSCANKMKLQFSGTSFATYSNDNVSPPCIPLQMPNTAISGTLGVTGATTLTGGIATATTVSGDLTVTSASGGSDVVVTPVGGGGGSASIAFDSDVRWDFSSTVPTIQFDSSPVMQIRKASSNVEIINGGGTFQFSSAALKAPAYATTDNCASPASPASCGSAPAGHSAVPDGSTTFTVNSAAVGANSQIFVFATAATQVATRIGGGITCNVNIAAALILSEASRVTGTSVTFNVPNPTGTDPLCIGWFILN